MCVCMNVCVLCVCVCVYLYDIKKYASSREFVPKIWFR